MVPRRGCFSRWEPTPNLAGDGVRTAQSGHCTEQPWVVMFDHLVIRPLASASSSQKKKKRLNIYLPNSNPKADNCWKEQWYVVQVTGPLASRWALCPLQRLPQVQVVTVSVHHHAALECLQQMHMSHLSLHFSPVVTLDLGWWKVVTQNRSPSPPAQVLHCLRVSRPSPSPLPVNARHCSQAFPDSSSFNPHSLSEVGNWGPQRLRNSQSLSSRAWLLSPPACPTLAVSPALLPTALCMCCCLSWSALTFPGAGSFPFFFLRALFSFRGRCHTYYNWVYMLHTSVDMTIV